MDVAAVADDDASTSALSTAPNHTYIRSKSHRRQCGFLGEVAPLAPPGLFASAVLTCLGQWDKKFYGCFVLPSSLLLFQEGSTLCEDVELLIVARDDRAPSSGLVMYPNA
jgi:hypothetical protein